MLIKCYNKTNNKALRDCNLKGLIINNSLLGVIMTTANNTRNIECGQSSKNHLTYGVGYNSRRTHKSKINGKHTLAYTKWMGMLNRCYDPKIHAKEPSYANCTVIDDWHDFQNFADWFYSHNYSSLGYQIDKDILVSKNKIYSPDTCCFVPYELNYLLLDSKRSRGKYPIGVSYRKDINRICATICKNGETQRLGYFDTVEDARQAYKVAKEAYVKEKALEWQDRIADNVFQALMNWTLES